MWPGEYPPEGRASRADEVSASRRFNVAGGVSPGRSPEPDGAGASSARFNVAGGVSPGRSVAWRLPKSFRHPSFNVAGGVSPGRSVRARGHEPQQLARFNVAGGVSPGRSRQAAFQAA